MKAIKYITYEIIEEYGYEKGVAASMNFCSFSQQPYKVSE